MIPPRLTWPFVASVGAGIIWVCASFHPYSRTRGSLQQQQYRAQPFFMMKPGKEVDEWGGSVWEEQTQGESKRDAGLEDLVKKVSTFFYENESFVHVFEVFVETNAHKIDLSVEEMKLEYTDLYDEYQALFEKEIEGFIETQGFSAEDFYERLREALERDPWCHEAVFAKIMTATADFDIFMNMMREAAEALPPKQPLYREDGDEDGSAGEEKGDRRRPSRK